MMRADEVDTVRASLAGVGDDRARETLEAIFRRERSQILAVLIRLTGDFALAEDALQEAFARALLRWPEDGVPPKPGAWITTTARRRAIDAVRRARSFRRRHEALKWAAEIPSADRGPVEVRPLMVFDQMEPPPLEVAQ